MIQITRAVNGRVIATNLWCSCALLYKHSSNVLLQCKGRALLQFMTGSIDRLADRQTDMKLK